MNLNSSYILSKLIRIFKVFFAIFVIALFLLNAIILNIYGNLFANFKGDSDEQIQVSSSLRLPVVRSFYNATNFTFETEDFNTLLNITDFTFVLNHPDKCGTSGNEDIFMIIFVHSAVKNFEKRDAIRKTWANQNNLQNTFVNSQIRVVFLVGQSNDSIFESQLLHENELFGDIIQGTFVDTYRNMTYKHLMGLKWVTYFCRNTRYVFKADDDVFVDLLQLTYYLKGTFGGNPRNLMACYLNKRSYASRSFRNKWRVSYKEYSQKFYPQYCAGWGIIMSPDVAIELYRISRSKPYFWIDDVFVSGILAQAAKINHTDLGVRVSIENDYIRSWLRSSELTIPPLFGRPDSDLTQIFLLWNKTVQYYKTKLNQTFYI